MKCPRRSIPVLGGSDLMPFGRHKGKSVAWMAENEPNYMSWGLRMKLWDVEDGIEIIPLLSCSYGRRDCGDDDEGYEADEILGTYFDQS